MGCASSKDKTDDSSGQASATSKGKVSQSEVVVKVNGQDGPLADDDGGRKTLSDVDDVSDEENGDVYLGSKTSRSQKANGSNRKDRDKNKGRRRSNKVKSSDGDNNNDDEKRKTKYPSYDQTGFNRRIRDRLIAATAGTHTEELEEAIKMFKRHNLSDNGDLKKADDRLYFLKLKKSLTDAVQRRHYKTLEKAIEEAQDSDYADELYKQIEEAERLRDHLEELDRHSHDILAMDQSTYSEIHRYHHPPYSIHETMMAAFLLLGEKERHICEWIDVQALLGKIGRESVKRRVMEFDTIRVEEDTPERAQELLNMVQLQEVKAASNGAAAFHVWATNMLKKIEKDRRKERNQRGTRNEQHSQMQTDDDRQEQTSTTRTPSPAKTTPNNKTKSRGKK